MYKPRSLRVVTTFNNEWQQFGGGGGQKGVCHLQSRNALSYKMNKKFFFNSFFRSRRPSVAVKEKKVFSVKIWVDFGKVLKILKNCWKLFMYLKNILIWNFCLFCTFIPKKYLWRHVRDWHQHFFVQNVERLYKINKSIITNIYESRLCQKTS